MLDLQRGSLLDFKGVEQRCGVLGDFRDEGFHALLGCICRKLTEAADDEGGDQDEIEMKRRHWINPVELVILGSMDFGFINRQSAEIRSRVCIKV